MKSKGLPNVSQLNHGSTALRGARLRATASAALMLICLVGLSFAVTDSSAKAGRRQKKANPPAAAPASSPAPAATTTTTMTTTTTTTTPTPAPAPPASPSPSPTAGQRVKLHYLRAGTSIATALNKIAEPEKSVLKGLAVNVVSEDEVIVIGTETQRKIAGRIIATLDLPRPGVQMEMWGVQISSKRPEDLAEVMRRVRAEIDRTQQEVRDTFAVLQELARDIPDDRLDGNFKTILEARLLYKSALDMNRPLSLSDVLLRLIATKDPVAEAGKMAVKLDGWLIKLEERRRREMPDVGTKQCKSKLRGGKAVTAPARPKHFRHFFWSRGFEATDKGEWVPRADWQVLARNARIGKTILLDFALNYGRLVHDPDNFDPYYLQQSAGALNTRLQSNIDALNQDMEEIFVVPTLDRIRLIVAEFCDVEYAQVGRTTVATLSGAQSIVSAGSVNTFDFIRPLNLSEFLTSAKALTDKGKALDPGPATTNMLGTVPFSEVVGLIGALGADRTETRKTTTEFSVIITPNVLRDMNSAELDVDLKTGDPLAGGTQQEGTPQFTRVSDHDVKTKVYVNALDFFDLSAFGSQATMNGGRGYVPIIGPLWRGLFGEAPVIGEFLSWKKKPQSVYSQSLALTTSFITPTAMGVALLVPTDARDKSDKVAYRMCFDKMEAEVSGYGDDLFKTNVKREDAATREEGFKQCMCDNLNKLKKPNEPEPEVCNEVNKLKAARLKAAAVVP